MKNDKGIIGHVNHGSTYLSSAVLKVLSKQEQKVIVVDDKKERGIRPSFKGVEPMIITNPHVYDPEPISGRESRRLRRKNQRKK